MMIELMNIELHNSIPNLYLIRATVNIFGHVQTTWNLSPITLL
jgi:hypothetical protein